MSPPAIVSRRISGRIHGTTIDLGRTASAGRQKAVSRFKSRIFQKRTISRLREFLWRRVSGRLLAVPMTGKSYRWRYGCAAKIAGSVSSRVVDLFKTFATQSALAIQNARLFSEIEDKSRQIEAANRHKSESLANMSMSFARRLTRSSVFPI